jgi:hypothetical protein
VRCAKCGRRIFRYSLRNANWCPNDEVYLCRHCLTELRGGTPGTLGRFRSSRFVCPACHTEPLMRRHPALFVGAILVVLLSSILFAIFAGSFFADSAIEETPRVALSQVTIGATVHVAGTIVAPYGATVLWGHYVPGAKTGHWNYYGTTFGVRANNVTLAVDATHITSIYTAPDWTNNSDDMAFHQADHVELIGSIVGSPTAPTLEAKYAAMGPDDFLPAYEGWVALISAALLFAVALLALYLEALGLERGRKHRDHTQGPNAFQYRLPTAPSPPEGPAPVSE